MSFGPWYRLHIGENPNLALFLQSTIHYASYFGSTEGIQNLITIDEEIRAKGINASLGIGISYAMADRVVFDVGCDFLRGRFWGTQTDNNLGLSHDIVLDRGKFLFSFGFSVLFGKVREDE